jgi:hypothetical protein
MTRGRTRRGDAAVSHSAVFVATFLAAAVELTEMVIIVVASAPSGGGGRPGLAPQRAWPSRGSPGE